MRWCATLMAALAALDGHGLDGPLAEAAELLALVAGQDVEAGEDGDFRIARRVARDRLISTVDVEARHGHKSRARTFDGYKTHLGVDPDDELITNVAVTAGQHRRSRGHRRAAGRTRRRPARRRHRIRRACRQTPATTAVATRQGGSESKDFEVYGDSAYADGATLDEQTARGHDMRTKVPPVRNANGYSKDQFSIDLAAGTVTCPAHHTVAIRDGRATASPASASSVRSCPLRADLHDSPSGTGDQHPPP